MNSQQFEALVLGQKFGERATLSNWHLATATALFYDAGPNHVDPEHSANNRFGGLIAAFLETHVKFVAPVFVGDTIDILWEVRDLQPKASFSGGIVTLQGWCWTAKGDRLAVEMEAKLAINNAQPPKLHEPPHEESRP
ncbi:MAG: hypothetical protein E6I73_16565 [Chloroflexi bacterium]|nr:MAG: hypothetical protein E6I73_16565 [Chloroflexota bacterium]